jgi:putative ABC transport system permease protein
MLHSLITDCRYGLRLLRNNPVSTSVAIMALAIGIGANAGVFGVVNALLLRSLPFREPGRLALFRNFIPPHDTVKQFHEWRTQSAYLADAALTEDFDVNLDAERAAARARVAQTSWNFFSVLGTQPILGRGFAPEEDVDGTGWGTPGENAVAVIGYGLWQGRFGGDPRILGSTIRVDGHPLTIIGVAPPGFDYPGKAVLWKPAAFSRGNNGWSTIARLRPQITWTQAGAAFAAEVARLSTEVKTIEDFNLRPRITSLQEGLAGPVKNASLVFQAAMLLVLLIACSNVANLLIVRTLQRLPELSIRSALGASGSRLARQLLIECMLLSLLAMLGGLFIAFCVTFVAARVQPPPLGTQSYSILDVRVLGYTALISLFTALAFGVLPSLHGVRIADLRGNRFGDANGSVRVREILAGVQVMLTMVLLAGSVSMGRAFTHLMEMDRGYDAKGIVTVNVSLEGTTHQLEKRQLAYFEEVLNRLRKMPGVQSASATEFLPLYASGFVGGPFGVDGRPANLNSMKVPVFSQYFETMGGRLLTGREFTDAEVSSGAKVAMVNERFAEEFGGAAQVIGHLLTTGAQEPRKIVGVVRGMEYETDPAAVNSHQVFVTSERPGSFFSTFVARVDGRAEIRLAEIRDAIQSVDPQVPVFGAKTMEERLDEIFARPKLYKTAAWILAAFGIGLVLIGIYGIVSYAVVLRQREMGVRMAVGATPFRVRGMLLRQSLLMVAAGAVPGIFVSKLTGRFLETLIRGASPVDVATSIGLVLAFAGVATASIWIGTHRLAKLDVMTVLRAE